jgi:hypothetical protein
VTGSGSLFQAIPGILINEAFGGIFSIMTWPFRTAFNFIADAWNNTIGRLSWSVPGWVPGIGGKGCPYRTCRTSTPAASCPA